MNRASPVEIRQMLEAVDALAKAGIMFVPVPVLDDAEKARYLKLMNDQLRRAEELAIGGDE